MTEEQFLNLVSRIYFYKIIKSDIPSLGELIDKLAIANTKLFEVCRLKNEIAQFPARFSKMETIKNAEADIELCKQRAKLKGDIDRILMGKYAIKEIKNYEG